MWAEELIELCKSWHDTMRHLPDVQFREILTNRFIRDTKAWLFALTNDVDMTCVYDSVRPNLNLFLMIDYISKPVEKKWRKYKNVYKTTV